jgi:hypothetical protein
MKYLCLLIYFLNFTISAQNKNFETINSDNALLGFTLNQKMSEIPDGFQKYEDRWIRNLTVNKTVFCGYEIESIYLWIERNRLVNVKFYLKGIGVDGLSKLKNDFVSILGIYSYLQDFPYDQACDYPVIDWIGKNIHLSIFVTKDYPELEKCVIVITATSSTRFMRRLAGIE